jgi:Skp family chaperone for outer membrane proteins
MVLVTGCVWLLALSGTVAHAQAPSAATSSGGTLVALVDLSKVFEAHTGLKANLESMQQQAKGAETDLEAKQRQLSQRRKELAELDPSSADYPRLEMKLAREIADLQVQARQTKKDFLQREALQYYQSYREILTAVERVAVRHGIGLVLRFDSRDIDANDPRSVMQGMSRPVVLQRNLDITNMVVSELNTLLAAQPPNHAPRR